MGISVSPHLGPVRVTMSSSSRRRSPGTSAGCGSWVLAAALIIGGLSVAYGAALWIGILSTIGLVVIAVGVAMLPPVEGKGK